MDVGSWVASIWAYFAVCGSSSVLMELGGVIEEDVSSIEETEVSRERFAMLVGQRHGYAVSCSECVR